MGTPLLKTAQRAFPGCFRKPHPVGPKLLAEMIARKMWIPSPGFGMFRQNMTHCLRNIKGPNAQYHTGDLEALLRLRLDFQSWMGITRWNPKGSPTGSNRAYFERSAHRWCRTKGSGYGQYFHALMKLMSRPSRDGETASNFATNNARLKNLFSCDAFMAHIRGHKLKVGFIGSLAE